MTASIATLSDHFDQGTVNTLLWTVPTYTPDTGSGLSMASVSTATVPTSLNLSPAFCGLGLATSAVLPVVNCGNDTGIGSIAQYDLTGYGVSVEFASYTSDSHYVAAFQLSQTGSPERWMRWRTASATQMYAEDWVNGPIASFTFTTAEFRYLRIREDSGTTYFDYSPDGITWTNGASETNSFTVTTCNVSLYGNYSSGSGTVGSVSWGNLNYVL